MYCVRNIATCDLSCWLAIYHIIYTIVSVQALGGPTLTVQVGIACMYIKIYKSICIDIFLGNFYYYLIIILEIYIMKKEKERTKCERYSRVVGYLRPVAQWNDGKQEEFKDRKLFTIKEGI